MRRIFIQFYLLLFVCFSATALTLGLVYRQTVEETGTRYLHALFRSTLILLENTFADVPVSEWSTELQSLHREFPTPVNIEPLSAYELDTASESALMNGDIVMIEEENTYLRRIHDTQYMMELGPVPYLAFLHTLKWVDYLMLVGLGMLMGIPAFLWMRPYWRELTQLVSAANALGRGRLDTRAQISPKSGLSPLADAFNGMAEDLQHLLRNRRELLNAVSHELRTPVSRMNYRLAMLPDTPELSHFRDGMAKDLETLDSLLAEWLTYAKLEGETRPSQLAEHDAALWLDEQLDDWHDGLPPGLRITHALDLPEDHPLLRFDSHEMRRALSNLLRNALRHARSEVCVTLGWQGGTARLEVEDDGPGIPEEQRRRVLEPFVRLDASRDRKTGGHGLGLSIVARIAQSHQGRIEVSSSPQLGGARITLEWPSA